VAKSSSVGSHFCLSLESHKYMSYRCWRGRRSLLWHPWRNSLGYRLPSRSLWPWHGWRPVSLTRLWGRSGMEAWPGGDGYQNPGPWASGAQNSAGDGGSHVDGFSTLGDPPHGTTGAWLVWEPYNRKNSNSKLNKKRQVSYDMSGHGVEGSPGVVGWGSCGYVLYEDMSYCMNYVNH
jgi:hypothetical protein